MENWLMLLLLAITATGKAVVVSAAAAAYESPQFRVVHLESDFEIRLYKEISWMTALVRGTSFENSTKRGFHRLYQYLQGANRNSTRFFMTKPVLTSIIPSQRGGSPSSYIVRYYLPAEYNNKSPPPPSAELNLQLDKWKSHCIAVRKFSGYARDDNVEKEKDALGSSLGKRLMQGVDQNQYYNYSIAQYNASKHPTGRINEVWIDVSGFADEGCPV